ncbi:MAG: aminopeptidase [Bacteroidales bacterium]|nr:aminopeptidase [Bacteroidales bacterium]
MHKNYVSITVFLIFSVVSLTALSQNKELLERLRDLPEVEEVNELNADSLFESKYMLMVNQPIDHDNPEGPSFSQRVFLSHIDYEKPVVFITEGYSAYYAISSRYVHELSALLGANQVTVEHRYFGKSKPEPMKWKHLTTRQAAADQHRIITILKKIYTDTEWINTGISKGGQTAIFHRYYYPDDVDASLGYVCPLNFSFEDKRVYDFLENVGSDSCRKKLLEFQKTMLKQKDIYLPMFSNKVESLNYSYPFSLETAYEMIILEYSFAFWQWGHIGCEDIPSGDVSDTAKFRHLARVSPLDYFANRGLERMRPFFYQAMTEIGYYGYDPEPFGDLISATRDNTFMFALPDTVDVEYKYNLMNKVNHWLQTNAKKMLFIYGENDPWSATAVETANNPTIYKIIKSGGSHRTRIRNLPENQQEKVYRLLKEWIGGEPHLN